MRQCALLNAGFVHSWNFSHAQVQKYTSCHQNRSKHLSSAISLTETRANIFRINVMQINQIQTQNSDFSCHNSRLVSKLSIKTLLTTCDGIASSSLARRRKRLQLNLWQAIVSIFIDIYAGVEKEIPKTAKSRQTASLMNSLRQKKVAQPRPSKSLFHSRDFS